jgi:adenylate cyclase
MTVTDLGQTPLKNIAEAVRVYSLEVGQPGRPKPAPPAQTQEKPISPPRLSLVVLPFANIGGDAEQDYFVDGVTEPDDRPLAHLWRVRDRQEYGLRL